MPWSCHGSDQCGGCGWRHCRWWVPVAETAEEKWYWPLSATEWKVLLITKSSVKLFDLPGILILMCCLIMFINSHVSTWLWNTLKWGQLVLDFWTHGHSDDDLTAYWVPKYMRLKVLKAWLKRNSSYLGHLRSLVSGPFRSLSKFSTRCIHRTFSC